MNARRLLSIPPAALLLALVTAAPVAAQAPRWDDDEETDVVVQQQQNVFMMDDSNFEMWVFGGNRNGEAAKKRLDDLLRLQVEFIDRACGLNDAQRKKLELAGRGDVKRFYDRIDVCRKKFQKVKGDQNKIGEIYQEIQPLQLVLNAGPFGDGSLFSKTLPRALNPAQAAKFEEADRDRRQFRYGAKVGLAIARLDSSLALTSDQRRRLADVLRAETKPPRQFGNLDQQVVMYQASQIPEAKLRGIFDDAQWRIMGRQLATARGTEFNLKANGYVPADDTKGYATSKPPSGK